MTDFASPVTDIKNEESRVGLGPVKSLKSAPSVIPLNATTQPIALLIRLSRADPDRRGAEPQCLTLEISGPRSTPLSTVVKQLASHGNPTDARRLSKCSTICTHTDLPNPPCDCSGNESRSNLDERVDFRVWIDGLPIDPDRTTLASISRGSRFSIAIGPHSIENARRRASVSDASHWLVQVRSGPDAGAEQKLPTGRATIGRSAENDLHIDDPGISSFHVVVTTDDGDTITVVDNNSTNGTFLSDRTPSGNSNGNGANNVKRQRSDESTGGRRSTEAESISPRPPRRHRSTWNLQPKRSSATETFRILGTRAELPTQSILRIGSSELVLRREIAESAQPERLHEQQRELQREPRDEQQGEVRVDPLRNPPRDPPRDPLRDQAHGAALVAYQHATNRQRPATDEFGMRPFHRQPRTIRSEFAASIVVPSPPAKAASSVRFSVSAIFAPLIVGLGMAVFVSPRMALFAVMSPVLFLFNFAEDRTRARRNRKTGQLDLDRQLVVFEDLVRDGVAHASVERLVRYPDLATLRSWVHGPDRRLWERRSWHRDAWVVRLGMGTERVPLPFKDTTPSDGNRLPVVDEIVERHSLVSGTVIAISLEAGTVIGIVGDRVRRNAVARSLLTQLCVLHGPVDLRCGAIVRPEQTQAWDWMRWLAHATQTEPVSASYLETSERAEQFISALFNFDTANAPSLGGQRDGPHVCMIIDAVDLITRSGPIRSLLNEMTLANHRRAMETVQIGRVSSAAVNGPEQSLRDSVSGHGPVAILLVDEIDQLPDCTTDVVLLDAEPDDPIAHDTLRSVRTGALTSLNVDGLSMHNAEETAAGLARFIDTASRDSDSELPGHVAFSEFFGDTNLLSLAARWIAAPTNQRSLSVPIGISSTGPVVIDLVTDGPHGLVAGTTGSGKSELLRTLVISLATTYPPTLCNFVLIDYKGGSAFAECALLPHTVGIVTDLDQATARRALICLEAELKRRERMLADAGAEDLIAYASAPVSSSGALPRLVVIIDEFATLAKDLPEFLASILDIAQRGRSLGVHVVLATQRPTGAVNDNIRANTNLRISLRVHDAADSTDVLGVPDGARLSRHVPGRALVRTGPGELVMFQTATTSATPSSESQMLTVRIAPSVFAHNANSASAAPMNSSDVPMTANSLEREPQQGFRPPDVFAGDESLGREHVSAAEALSPLRLVAQTAQQLAASMGMAQQRRPWPDPLPQTLLLSQIICAHNDQSAESSKKGKPESATLERIEADADLFILGVNDVAFRDAVVIGLADLPDQQRRCFAAYDTFHENLATIGMASTGASAALVTVGVQAMQTRFADKLHVYGIDFGAGLLRALSAFAHVGSIVGASDRERQERLLRMLTNELHVRRTEGRYDIEIRGTEEPRSNDPKATLAIDQVQIPLPIDPVTDALTDPVTDPLTQNTRPHILVIIDNYPALRSFHDDTAGIAFLDRLHRLIADGPAYGITFALSSDRPGGIPAAVASSIGCKLVFRLSEAFDYAHVGLAPKECAHIRGLRAIDATTKREVEIFQTDDAALNTLCARSIAQKMNPRSTPKSIEVLPTRYSWSAMQTAIAVEAMATKLPPGISQWFPLGIGDETLEPIGLSLAEHDCALVTGPPRSGKTNTLRIIAETAIREGIRVHCVFPRYQRTKDLWPHLGPQLHLHESIADAIDSYRGDSVALDSDDHDSQHRVGAKRCGHLLLIDDAELVDDPNGDIAKLLTARHSHHWIIAAGRADVLRLSYTHWSMGIRRSRIGIALRPQLDMDGDLWATALPRRVTSPSGAGRGFLVADGMTTLVQVANIAPQNETSIETLIETSIKEVPPPRRQRNTTNPSATQLSASNHDTTSQHVAERTATEHLSAESPQRAVLRDFDHELPRNHQH